MDLPIRPRRLRATPALRDLVRETRLHSADFILPLFVDENMAADAKREIGSMPGVFRHGHDAALALLREARDAGIRGALLFGIPTAKDAVGSGAHRAAGGVQRLLAAAREKLPELALFSDVCLCEYTDHGHCGPLDKDGNVVNDAAVEIHCITAVSHARAGAHFVAPSDMMDGRVGAIRDALDAAGFHDTGILSYAVKYASGFYGPFRDAADSAPAFGDRRAYQMDPANLREAEREALLDESEGADMLMVKPAMPYLDVLRRVREITALPLAAYQVSGEYAMLKAAAEKGWLDYPRVLMESLTSIKRAGADMIISYASLEALPLL